MWSFQHAPLPQPENGISKRLNRAVGSRAHTGPIPRRLEHEEGNVTVQALGCNSVGLLYLRAAENAPKENQHGIQERHAASSQENSCKKATEDND